MQNKKLTIAGFCALIIVVGLLVLSYQKEEQGGGNGAYSPTISQKNPAGTYAAFVGGADVVRRTVIIQLAADDAHTATMSSDFQSPQQQPIIDRGTWAKTSQGFNIVFSEKNGITLTTPEVWSFRITGSRAELINPDRVTWGSEGLVLFRPALLLPSEWVWTSTDLKDGTRIVPRKDRPFILSFTGDNKVSVRGDCNSFGGTFGLRDNNGIVFYPLASTRMFCEDSRELVFTQDLARAISYTVKNSTLTLGLPNASGSMIFTRYSEVY